MINKPMLLVSVIGAILGAFYLGYIIGKPIIPLDDAQVYKIIVQEDHFMLKTLKLQRELNQCEGVPQGNVTNTENLNTK